MFVAAAYSLLSVKLRMNLKSYFKCNHSRKGLLLYKKCDSQTCTGLKRKTKDFVCFLSRI